MAPRQMYVVVEGNIADGFDIYGRFRSVDEATAWAEDNLRDESWHVVRLNRP